MDFATLNYEADGPVAWVTLNRPDRLNAFDGEMVAELQSLWRQLRFDDAIRAIVLTGAGEKAFCTGIDRNWVVPQPSSPFMIDDPGMLLGPKTADLWKPVVAAVNGMACGGAFYLLGEVETIVAADHATFFDPHVTYSMVAVYEPLLLLPRMPFGEVVRMALTGAHERISARRALEVGFVSEVLPLDDVIASAQELASVIASQPPRTVQSTVRSLWAARDLTAQQSLELGNLFLHLGTSVEALSEGQDVFASGTRITPKVR